MRVAFVNAVNFGSTGNIVLKLADLVEQEAGVSMVCVANTRSNQKKKSPRQYLIGNRFLLNANRAFFRLFGRESFLQKLATGALIRRLKAFHPDVIHLHNLHGWYLDVGKLFRYIKKQHVKVVWTLHDCWSLTGGCPHFELIKCDKWKNSCLKCPQYREYPGTWFDHTAFLHKAKKKWFGGVENLEVVTPSRWLAELVRQSYLGQYPIHVIHNGIDLDVFRPRESDFRARYNCEGKYLILGVCFGWDFKKGLDVFLELERRLPDRYRIVLVGTNAEMDETLPTSILSIHRTQDQVELAQIYTAADLFVNPTREDTFPTVNMEALACGTPVLTFATGGSPEIPDESCGAVVPRGDVDAMEKEILRITQGHCFDAQACCARARLFCASDKFAEYIDLYKN